MNELIETTFSEDLYSFPEPLTVVLHQPWNTVTDEEKILLGKILASVRQSISSVKILHATSLDTAKLTVPTKLICFGVTLSPAVPMYQITNVAGLSIISADNLATLDDGKKKNLWTALKQLL